MNTINIIKQEETYLVGNKTVNPGYYSIIMQGCAVTDKVIQSGNLAPNESFLFEPKKDGDYVINLSTDTGFVVDGLSDEVTSSVTISHYPLLLKSVISDVRDMLCGCGCPPMPPDCANTEAIDCLKYQNLFGEILLVSNLIKSVNACGDNKFVIPIAIANAVVANKCELYSLFCGKRVEERIKGQAAFNKKIVNKLISIIYLMLYLYEKEITNPEQKYLKFLNDKYDYKVIKGCILKAEIDVLEMEHIFTEAFYDGCIEEPIVCSLECFQPIGEPQTFLYEYDLGTQLNTILHTVQMKNTCASPQLFVNRVIYKDATIRIIAKAQAVHSPVEVLPGEVINVDIIAIGTKNIYTLLNIAFIYEGTLVNTYKLLFRDIVVTPNTPPTITAILKTLPTREPYRFTIADFEANFTDIDGDIMAKVVLVGDTARFTLSNIPYTSGIIITRENITNLVYTPLAGDTEYNVVLNWLAYDDKGNESN